MKKHSLLVFLLFFSIPSVLFGQTTLQMKIAELPPHSGSDMKDYGMFPQILAEILKDRNYSISYKFYPVVRLMEMQSQGRIQGSFSDESIVDKKKFYVKKILYNQIIFFYKKSKFPYGLSFNKLSDLSNYRIGTIRGTPSENILIKAGITVDSTGYDLMNFKKLKSDRVDLLTTIDSFGLYQIKKLGLMLYDYGMSVPYTTSTSVIIINKSDPNAAKIYSDIVNGFNEAKKINSIFKIVETYIGKGKTPTWMIP